MNNFNPDQNQHILSSPEIGGGNGSFGGSNLNEGGEIRADAIEVEDLDQELPPLEDELDFDTDLETGLSTALTTIESLQAQIQTLEEGGTRYQEIKSQIEIERATEKTNLENSLEENKTKLNQLYANIFTRVKARVEFTGSEAHKSKIDEYLEKYKDNEAVSSIKAKFDTFKRQIQELTATLATFDTETESQIQASIQAEKGTLQESLSKAQGEYSGSDAEANDKKVLLERQFQEQLTDPNQLFSDDNIASIFAIYGLKEGLKKLEELKQESDQAREQADRDEIRKDIMARVDWYTRIPELAEALSTDIKTKLEALQESDLESDTIKEALSLEGTDRLDYLVNSKDPQLQGLAFWFSQYRQDRSDSNILDEHPKFAQYVDRETNKIYEQQQQDIKSGRIDGQKYLGSVSDNTRRVEIDNRISTQLERYKNTKIQELQRELSGLQYDETGGAYDTQDRAMLSEQEKLRPYDINQFQTELKTALESGQIKFEQGQFSALENIPEKQREINRQLETLFGTIKPVLEAAGYRLQSLESLPNIANNIENDKQEANKKPFGLGKKQAQALVKLLEEVDKTISKYNQLQAEKRKNSEQFENNNQSISKLKEFYQKLPQSIQKSLTSLENPNFETITQTINIGVESIQNYQTPPEIAEKRSQIQAIESKIAETRAITAPTASTQSSV